MCDCHLIAGHTFMLQSCFNVAAHWGLSASEGGEEPRALKHLIQITVIFQSTVSRGGDEMLS